MKILAIAGKKGSGKTTLSRLLCSKITPSACLAFADPLKDVCEKILGLSFKQLHGDEHDKNTFTLYRQRDMPHWTQDKNSYESARHLTAREVMQQMGTEVFRRLDPDIWVKALLRKAASLHDIAHERYKPLIIVHDARFPNEVQAIRAVGGKSVYLMGHEATPLSAHDTHASETSLNGFDDYDLILDNHGLDPEATLARLMPWIDKWGMLS